MRMVLEAATLLSGTTVPERYLNSDPPCSCAGATMQYLSVLENLVKGIVWPVSVDVPTQTGVLFCCMASAGSMKKRAMDCLKSFHWTEEAEASEGITSTSGDSPFQEPLMGPSRMAWPLLGMLQALG